MKDKRLGMIGFLLFAVSCSSPSASISSGKSGVTNSSGRAGQASSGAVDLTEITEIQGKGRVQDKDYQDIPVVDQLIAQGPSCIPFLIDRLDDETRMNPEGIALWNRVAVADVALMILTDFFTDSSWEKSTVPKADWNSIIEYPQGSGMSAETALREFVLKHGRGAIKQKWTKIWEENRAKIFWDENERCFNIKKN